MTDTADPSTMAQEEYLAAKRSCDLVMKGGVTSGVIYPAAACELAKEYTFRHIGGTSAGGIAAALTAAAEYRRSVSGSADGFLRLKSVPTDLGTTRPETGKSTLFSLFDPDKATRAVFETATAGINQDRPILRIALAALKNFRGWALLGALPGAAITVAALGWGVGFTAWLSILSGLLILCVGVGASVAWGMTKACRTTIPENFYGLSSGHDPNHIGSPRLTDWLVSLLDEIAGVSDRDQPLTFGDLWGAEGVEDSAKRVVALQFMTTNLSHGRPYQLPFEANEERLFHFDPMEFRRLFPERIVGWMEDHPRPSKTKYDGLKPLPLAKDMPVAVAARMSLSFPVLISAVPLHAVDYRLEQPQPERCWFSDGGIASNFPVHFFDDPIPARPTFAINLRARTSRAPYVSVFMPEKNNEGMMEAWVDVESEGKDRLGLFLQAVVGCMQSWNDNTLLRLPGFRDRVVHVHLSEREGGLNLAMSAQQIDDLAGRGVSAAQKLTQSFVPDKHVKKGAGAFSWNNHRWVRYRTTMALLEKMLLRMLEIIESESEDPDSGEGTYGGLLDRPTAELPGYRWNPEKQRDFAQDMTTRTLDLARKWRDGAQSVGGFEKGAPSPAPELRVRPRI